jgi:hypothetical protein
LRLEARVCHQVPLRLWKCPDIELGRSLLAIKHSPQGHPSL